MITTVRRGAKGTHGKKEAMELTIMYRNTFEGGDGWTYYPKVVTVGDKCLICGAPRAQPQAYSFCEDGEWFCVDRWNNECGHVEPYKAVYEEWKSLREKTA